MDRDMMTDSQGELFPKPSLRDFLHVVFKRKSQIALFFVVTVSVVTLLQGRAQLQGHLPDPHQDRKGEYLSPRERHLKPRVHLESRGADQLGDRDPQESIPGREGRRLSGPSHDIHGSEQPQDRNCGGSR